MIVIGTSLFIVCLAAGCVNPQMHQSLLIHENRRLEDALYAVHAQVADLKRENGRLREQQANGFFGSSDQSRVGSWNDHLSDYPSVEMPKVILPIGTGTTEVPETLRGSQTVPDWSPDR
jgi:hypothetical protein